MANPPIAKGNLITVDQFNELISNYHAYWSDAAAFAFSELAPETIYDHSRGWGQNPVEPIVNREHIITATDTNRLVAQINAGKQHMTDSPNYLLKYSPTAKIYASSYTLINGEINLIDSNRFALSELYADSSFSEITISTDPVGQPDNIWNTSINCIGRIRFSSYAQARYFFNSGGKIVLNLSAYGGTAGSGIFWDDIFAQVGSIEIGATETTNTGTASGIVSGGFYSTGTAGSPNEVISINANTGGGEYGFGEYGDYGSGAYESRSIVVKLESEETEYFDIFCHVILNESDYNNGNIDAIIEVDMGYKKAVDAPFDAELDTSNGANFKADSYTYQFEERETPDMAIEQEWIGISSL